MSRAELANLLADCLVVWGAEGRCVPEADGIAVIAAAGSCLVTAAGPERRPARWLLQTEARAAAGRPPQAAHSITGLLGGVREAIGAAMAGSGLDVVEAEILATNWDARP